MEIILNELIKFDRAWKKFCEFYEKYGSHKEKGYVQKEHASYMGKYFWSEQDVVLHLSRFLEEEFGVGWIHNELSVSKHTFKNFEKEKESKGEIDIVISNPEKYGGNWRESHEVFIEVKQITKGMIFNDAKKKIEGAKEDFEKLSRQCRNDRCHHAFVCIVDDDPENSQIDKNIINKWKSNSKCDVNLRLWQPSS